MPDSGKSRKWGAPDILKKKEVWGRKENTLEKVKKRGKVKRLGGLSKADWWKKKNNSGGDRKRPAEGEKKPPFSLIGWGEGGEGSKGVEN